MSQKKKQKPRRFSHEFKKEATRRMVAGESPAALARELGVTRRIKNFGDGDVIHFMVRWRDPSLSPKSESDDRHTKKPPACAGGSCSCSRVAAYRLAWRLAPPLAPAAWLPRTSPMETSLTQSEPLPL